MKKADTRKEQIFIERYCLTGNAKASAIASGYKESSATSMGHYLKKKFRSEIRDKQEERINSVSGIAITTLTELLHSEQDSVRLNTAKLILKLGNYHATNINFNVDKESHKTDEELIIELKSLMKDMPNLNLTR